MHIGEGPPVGSTPYLDETMTPSTYTVDGNNVVVTGSSTSNGFIPASFPSAGRSYYEIKINTVGFGRVGFGYIDNIDHWPTGGDPFSHPDGCELSSSDGDAANGTSFGLLGLGSWSNGDVIQLCHNHTTGQVYYGKNGTWADDPTNVGTQSRTLTTKGGEYYLCLGLETAGSDWTARFEEEDFEYSIPAGWKAARASYEAATTPPSTGLGTDPYWDEVLLLGGWDGADGSQPATDEGPLGVALTYIGSCETDTAQAPAGGDSTGSLYTNNEGHSLTMAGADLGSIEGDFTFECHVRFWSLYLGDAILADGGGTGQFFFGKNTSGQFHFAVNSLPLVVSGTTVVSTDTNYHVAVSRSGLVTRLFVDGALEGTFTETTPTPCTVNARQTLMYLGRNAGTSNGLKAWVDELRVTRAARYTAAFTAPTGRYPRD